MSERAEVFGRRLAEQESVNPPVTHGRQEGGRSAVDLPPVSSGGVPVALGAGSSSETELWPSTLGGTMPDASNTAGIPCECDPTLDYGPNNADCPRHGAEVRHWEAWARGERRCPYCEGEEWADFVAMCDCFQAERELKAATGV